MIDGRILPHNLEAEEAVIGSLLIGGDIAELTLQVSDFYHEQYAMMYKACQQLNDSNAGINQITLAQRLNANGDLEAAGGVSVLSYLISVCPTHTHLRYYADIVMSLSLARRLIKVGEDIINLGYAADSDAVGCITKADGMLLDLRRQSSSNTIITPSDRATLLLDRYEELYKTDKSLAVRTGLSKLDYWLGGGLYKGELVIVAGRPGMGKTCLLQNIANSISRDGIILFCSAEMNEESISHRDVAALIGVPTFRIRQGSYTEELYGEIVGKALGEISERRVYLFDDTPLTADKIMQASIAMQLRYGLTAVFVDYLGMIDEGQGENQNIRLGNITRRLKYIARKLNIPVVVAHQLSRGLEQRVEKRPQLHDLRESGHIEEDADIVLFIYRDSYYEIGETKSDSGVTEIIVGKHRQGQSNIIVKVWFDSIHQHYGDLVGEQVGF